MPAVRVTDISDIALKTMSTIDINSDDDVRYLKSIAQLNARELYSTQTLVYSIFYNLTRQLRNGIYASSDFIDSHYITISDTHTIIVPPATIYEMYALPLERMYLSSVDDSMSIVGIINKNIIIIINENEEIIRGVGFSSSDVVYNLIKYLKKFYRIEYGETFILQLLKELNG